jgi:hypothetical protein
MTQQSDLKTKTKTKPKELIQAQVKQHREGATTSFNMERPMVLRGSAAKWAVQRTVANQRSYRTSDGGGTTTIRTITGTKGH